MSEVRANPARERHWVYAQRLRERRLQLRLTQREVVARLQESGNRTTNRALSAMENGRGLDLGLLPELAEALRCTVTYLLGLTSDPSSWHPGGTAAQLQGTRPTQAGPATGTLMAVPDEVRADEVRANGVPANPVPPYTVPANPVPANPVPAADHADHEVPVAGILGPHLPAGFTAPVQARRRGNGNHEGRSGQLPRVTQREVSA